MPAESGPSRPGKELGDFVIAEGFDWAQFKVWGLKEGHVNHDCNGFDELPAATARRLLKAKVGLLAGLRQIREEEAK